MCVSVDFALIHQAFLVIVKKLDGILDGDHVLFTFAVDLVKHGSERGGLAGARRAGHKDESTGLVAQSLHDQRQSKSVEAFDFPRNRTKDRAYSTALIENVAAKASQVFQAKGKIQLQVFFEAVLLRVRQNAISKRFGVCRRQRGHVQRPEPAVHTDAWRAVRRDVEVAAAHLDHLLQQFTQRDSSHQSPSVLQNRFAQDFFHGGLSKRNLDQTAAPQGDHALLDRFFLQLQRRGANKNQFAQLIVNFHDLVEARAALVAALVTGSAAFAVVNLGSLGLFGSVPSVDQCLLRNLQLFLAVRTDAPHETLRANQVHRRGHEKRLDTHVHQAADGRRRVVGVQRREHQVSRERGLDSDFRRFKVANLADQNDVGILAQEGAERGGKVQANLLLHLYLVDAGQLELDRVFRGHDVGVDGV